MKFVLTREQVLVRKISKEIKNTDRQVKRMTKEELLETRVVKLEQDKKNLMNRCWALTNGLMCRFCDFKEDCVHKSKCKVRDRSNIYNNQGR